MTVLTSQNKTIIELMKKLNTELAKEINSDKRMGFVVRLFPDDTFSINAYVVDG